MAWPYLGRGSAVGIGEESTWGTAVSRTHWFRVVSSTVKRSVAKVPRGVLAESSGSRNRRSHYIGTDDVGGTIVILMGYEGLGMLLRHAMHGTPATTGPSGSIYTHTFKLGTAPPTGGLTVEVIRGTGSAEVFEGCRISKMSWEIEAAGLMKVTLDLIGQTSAGPTSAGTPTYTTNELDVIHHQCGTLSFNSATYTLKKFTVSLDNKLARRPLLGSKPTADPAPSDFTDVMFDAELEYEGDALLTALTADTESDAVISFSGVSSRSLSFTVHNAYLDDADVPVNTVGVLPLSVKFRGQSDGTDEGLQIAIANTQTTATAV